MPIPLGMMKRISSIQTSLPPLKKNDTNPDGGWKFVSIDDYYEHIAAEVVKGGIYWVLRQKGEIAETHDGIMLITYVVDLYDTEKGEVAEEAWSATISHPYQGAQTAGASMSFADKLFMRTLFKVVSGEKDSDAIAQNGPKKFPPKKPAQPKEPVMTVSDIFATVAGQFDGADTVPELNRALNHWAREMGRLRTEDPKAHAELQDIFEQNMERLTQKEKA